MPTIALKLVLTPALIATAGQPILRYTGQTSTIWSVTWSPDGAKIASASQDGTVQIWHPHP